MRNSMLNARRQLGIITRSGPTFNIGRCRTTVTPVAKRFS